MSDMKLSKDFRSSTVNQELFSTVNEDKFSMTIDPKSMNHIIARLTDLYADPIVATVREIISNAIDATRAIPEENRKPIDIVVPTLLSSEFNVTDHALGLSLSEIKNIYTRYGASTKGLDFSQIGAYGLGSKAPLSYTSEFTVETAKNGVFTSILVTVEDGINTVKILAHKKTDQDNFMKVSIPVKEGDIDSFRDALRTYNEHPMKDISFTGLDDIIPNEVDTFLGKMDYNGIPLNIYATNEDMVNYIITLLRSRTSSYDVDFNVKGILSGYEYSLTEAHSWNVLDFAIELIPGIVDFSSSRDEITNTSRKKNLIEAFNTFIKSEKAFDYFIKMLNADDDLKRKLFVRCSESNLYKEISDTEKSKLFTLSNGYILGLSNTRALGIIDSFRSIVSYKYKHHFVIDNDPSGNVSKINNKINTYFHPNEYNNKISDEELNNDEIIEASTVPVFSLLHWLSKNYNFIIVYGINNEREAKKVLRNRLVFFENENKNSQKVLVLLNGNKSDYQDELKKLLPSRSIEYLSCKEFNTKANVYRRANMKTVVKKDKKELYYALNCGSLTTNNAVDLYKYMHGQRLTGAYHQDFSKVDLSIALISGNESITNEKILPYLLLMKDNTVIKVTKFKAKELFLRNFDYLNETFDYILNLASSSDFRSSILLDKINKLSLPIPKMIDVEQSDVSELMKKVFRSLIINERINTIDNNYTFTRDFESIVNLLNNSSHYMLFVPDFQYNRYYDFTKIKKCKLISNNQQFNSMVDKIIELINDSIKNEVEPVVLLAQRQLSLLFK